jgi:rare lipoprotein A
MFVPTTLDQPRAALAPVGIASTAPALAPPTRTWIKVMGSKLDVLGNNRVTVTGRLLGDAHLGVPGRVVALQELGHHRWRTLVRARTAGSGRFHLSYAPRLLGSQAVRLLFAGDAQDRATRHRLGRLNVFRLAGASWYGGGGSLACGGSLTSSTLGVANKTLPCGTLVTLRYGGRTIRVPVVDRGPYVEGRDYDLTEATKAALGFGGTGQVWATS